MHVHDFKLTHEVTVRVGKQPRDGVKQILKIAQLAHAAMETAAPDARGMLVGRRGLHQTRVMIEADVLGNGEWPAQHKRVCLLTVNAPTPDHARDLVIALRPILNALASCPLCQRNPPDSDPDLEIPF